MNKKKIVLAGLAAGSGHFHTPVQVQKLFFLIDRNISHLIGGPFFSFEAYNYGPFDAAVYRVLEGLNTEGLVEIAKDGTMNMYGLTDDGRNVGDEVLSNLEHETAKYIKDVSKFVRSLSFSKLVSAIYKAYPEMKQNSVFQQ